jgi:hypothetical protein
MLCHELKNGHIRVEFRRGSPVGAAASPGICCESRQGPESSARAVCPLRLIRTVVLELLSILLSLLLQTEHLCSIVWSVSVVHLGTM